MIEIEAFPADRVANPASALATSISIFAAHKDGNGDWHFGIMTNGGHEPVHYDIEETQSGGKARRSAPL